MAFWRYLAAMRGLMLDLLTTGDRARIEAAVKRVGDLIEAETRRAGPRRGRAAVSRRR